MAEHKHAAVIRAYASGSDVEFRRNVSTPWSLICNPSFRIGYEYRAVVVDPYAELKAARAAGKTLQFLLPFGDQGWRDEAAFINGFVFNYGVARYRVKPEPIERTTVQTLLVPVGTALYGPGMTAIVLEIKTVDGKFASGIVKGTY